MIDTLLRLKDTTKTTKEDEVVNLIGAIMDQNNGPNNKIASVQSTKGELAEFQALLHANLQKFSPQEL